MSFSTLHNVWGDLKKKNQKKIFFSFCFFFSFFVCSDTNIIDFLKFRFNNFIFLLKIVSFKKLNFVGKLEARIDEYKNI